MIFAIRRQYTMLSVRWSSQACAFEVLGHLLRGTAMAIDGLPCCGSDVGEFVGGDADNGAVLLVEMGDEFDGVALDAFSDEGETCCGVEFWAGVGGEGVQVDVVEDVAEECNDGLLRSVSLCWMVT